MDETGVDYRPVSRLAVAALAGGAVSALALASPIGWVIPLVAIGLAVAALADVNRPGAPKAGGLAAVAGLALAAGFGAQAVADAVATRWLVERRAVAAARHWIEAVRVGRLADALSVCAPRALPADGGIRGSDVGAAAGAAWPEREAAFAALATVRAVASCGTAAPRVTTITPADSTAGSWIVGASLTPCGLPEATLRIAVEPDRVMRQGGPVERWRVTGFTLDR
jgi:hypothetical protein